MTIFVLQHFRDTEYVVRKPDLIEEMLKIIYNDMYAILSRQQRRERIAYISP